MLKLFGKRYVDYDEVMELLRNQRDIETDLVIGTTKEIELNCFTSQEAKEKAKKLGTFHDTRRQLLNQIITELVKMEKRA